MTVGTDDRFTATGDEAGTAPGDRSFRPDVLGLRALAILLVVLYHAGIHGVGGGYVGVDVFFVISGFVITGVLLRERASTGSTSILGFYVRRIRRILPAATAVIVVTILVTYLLLSTVTARSTAVDGGWAAVFLANFHFVSAQTNYLASQRPPSPLQNYWSLAVEEQFYVVYPTVFLLVAGLSGRLSLRVKIGLVLVATIIGSYAWSIALTSSNASAAYFSPLTRAWELALGGLVAVASNSLRRLPALLAAGMSWLGLAGIVVAALVFSSATPYPGSLVAIPVAGAALILAGGTAQPAWGAESVLARRPCQWLGLVSYSFYLWHWPVLMIATQDRGTSSLPTADNLLWLLLALALAICTYLFIENPVRHSTYLASRRGASVLMGVALIGSSLVVTTVVTQGIKPDSSAIANQAEGSFCPVPTTAVVDSLRAAYRASHLPTPYEGGHVLRVLVIGDSTSCTLLPGLMAVGSFYGLQFEDGAVVGCGIVSGQLPPYYAYGVNIVAYTKLCDRRANEAEAAAIAAGPPNIVLWGSTDERDSVIVHRKGGNAILLQGTPKWRSAMSDRINRRVMRFVNEGAKVLLMLEPPQVELGSKLTYADMQYARMNALLEQVAARHSGLVGTLDLEARLCPSGPPCPDQLPGFAGDRGYGPRPDALHYGPQGALWVAQWLVPQIVLAAQHLS